MNTQDIMINSFIPVPQDSETADSDAPPMCEELKKILAMMEKVAMQAFLAKKEGEEEDCFINRLRVWECEGKKYLLCEQTYNVYDYDNQVLVGKREGESIK